MAQTAQPEASAEQHMRLARAGCALAKEGLTPLLLKAVLPWIRLEEPYLVGLHDGRYVTCTGNDSCFDIITGEELPLQAHVRSVVYSLVAMEKADQEPMA